MRNIPHQIFCPSIVYSVSLYVSLQRQVAFLHCVNEKDITLLSNNVCDISADGLKS